ncbi:MAG: hypothetical protein AB7N65_29215, partial [Vicinamibacterales bacterium]
MRRTLFCLLFVSYAYFYQGGGWNQNSRFALVRAITSDWSLRIDPYQANTGDKAFFDGHYYSDKAPGLALAALPAVEPVRLAYLAAGGDPETFAGLALLSWVATIFTVGLLTAYAGVVLFDLATIWGASNRAATFAVLTFGLTTPIWFMATIFIGHALSAACLLLAYGAATRVSAERRFARARSVDSVVDRARDRRHGWLVGVGAGWATVSEFPAAVPAILLALWTVWSAWPLGPSRLRRIAGTMTAGALLCAGVLMLYQYACFGSPFHLAYSSEQGDFSGMHQGLFGITRPTWSSLYQVLIGEYRGLLPLAPVMFVAPLGLYLQARRCPDARPAILVAAAIALFYVLLNASYFYWEGGWSLGPRHLTPALPFLSLGLPALWTAGGRLGRTALLAAALAGFVVSLAAVSTMVQPPANVARPFREIVWPAFRDGDLSLKTQTFVHHTVDPSLWRTHQEPKAAFNLGMKLGLDG